MGFQASAFQNDAFQVSIVVLGGIRDALFIPREIKRAKQKIAIYNLKV